MTKEITLTDILELENDPAVLDYRCDKTGIVLWPSIRVEFLKLLIGDLNAKRKSSRSSQKGHSTSQMISGISKAALFNRFKSSGKKADILITTHGLASYKENGYYKNRLSDYFVDESSRYLILEDLHDYKWLFPREHGHQNILFHDPIRALSSFHARRPFKKYNSSVPKEMVAFLRQRAKKLFGWDMRDDDSVKMISVLDYVLRMFPVRYQRYKNLLQRKKIKLLLGRCLAYGPGDLVAAAKDSGVVVAEYQHGTVHKGHYAYNYAEAILKSSDYQRTLPDHFLGYSKFWNDQINLPAKKHEIGNPHRTEQIKKYSFSSKNKDDDKGKGEILILGNYHSEKYLLFAKELSNLLPSSMRIVFRPHPLQREYFNSGNIPNSKKGFFIDKKQDIYESFESATIVLAEASTGLFEAIGLVDRIFIWDTEIARFAYKNHIFGSFTNAEDLINKIDNTEEGFITQEQVKNIWTQNWKENYRRFLREYGGINLAESRT